jgi:hypothetical protein
MKKNVSVFEVYHCKQASGRRIVFILVLVWGSVLFFIPYLGYLSLIAMGGIAVIWWILIKQARNGYYTTQPSSFLGLFAGLGWWFYDLFEYKFEVIIEDSTQSQNVSLDKLTPPH